MNKVLVDTTRPATDHLATMQRISTALVVLIVFVAPGERRGAWLGYIQAILGPPPMRRGAVLAAPGASSDWAQLRVMHAVPVVKPAANALGVDSCKWLRRHQRGAPRTQSGARCGRQPCVAAASLAGRSHRGLRTLSCLSPLPYPHPSPSPSPSPSPPPPPALSARVSNRRMLDVIDAPILAGTNIQRTNQYARYGGASDAVIQNEAQAEAQQGLTTSITSTVRD